MFSTVFSMISMDMASSGMLLAIGMGAGFAIALAVSAQRWLLWYLLGGMGYWLGVEAIYYSVSQWFTLSEWHSYVVAMGISWLPLVAWVLYRALRFDDVSQTVQQRRELEAARYVEHSPVYDDDYTPRFQ